MDIIKRNYKSDLDFILHVFDCKKQEISFPDFNFEVKLWAACRSNFVTAGCHDGECTNLYNDGGRIHVVLKAPKLGCGLLMAEFRADLPNEVYPDGKQTVFFVRPIGIELVRTSCGCPTTLSVEVFLPVIVQNGGVDKTRKQIVVDPVLRKKTIPLNAQPGIYYHNPNGWVRLGVMLKGYKDFDLNRAFPEGLPEKFMVVSGLTDGAIDYTYDREKNILRVIGGDDYGYGSVMLSALPTKTPPPTKRTLKYATADADGRLMVIGEPHFKLIEYKPEPPTVDEVKYLIEHHGYGNMSYTRQRSGHGKTYQIKQRKNSFSGKIPDYVEDPNATRDQKKKWCNVRRKLRRAGIIKVRKRARRTYSDWAVFTYVARVNKKTDDYGYDRSNYEVVKIKKI